MMVRMVSKTQVVEDFDNELDLSNPESLMIWIARVSSSKQNNPEYEKLLKYCINEGHWSVFEMIDVTFEIVTSRAIAQQIIRHRSFSIQEFSQRYQKAFGFETYDGRKQAKSNRQSSEETLEWEMQEWFADAQATINDLSHSLYMGALDKGIAREQARFLLPLSTSTRLFMKGSIRSWIHYLKVRNDKHTQKEHRDIAEAIQDILKIEFPTLAKALEW